MKNFYAILCVILLFSINSFAQVYSENFNGIGASVTSGVFNSGTGQPTLDANISIANNWTSYDHSGNLTTATDVVNFCSSGKGLRGYVIPYIGSNRKFKLVLNVAAGYTFNMASISYKHTSNINNGSSQVYINGTGYGSNFLIQQSCPGQTVTFTQALSLTGQVTIELIAGNSGTINNAEFVFDDFTINGSVDFNANNEFVKKSSIGGAGSEARLYNAETADFDGDNDKDIIALDEVGVFRLYKNNGNAIFDAGTSLFTSWGMIAVGDLDGDNDIDIAHSDGKIYLNNGAGVFTQLGTGKFRTSSLNIQNVKIADFNNDGKKDLLWLNASITAGENNEIWLNTGTTGNPSFSLAHSFDNVGAGPSTSAAIGDIDNDGDIDIITCSSSWNGRVYKNNGNGIFTATQLLNTYTGSGFITDWDKDGDNDFIAYDGYNNWGLRLWKNDGTGMFSVPSSSSLTDVSVGAVNNLVDLNNDGYLDIVCSNWGGYGRFILNSGCALTPQSQALSNSSNGVRVADFNNDGKMDILCLARDSASCIYLNYLNTKTYVPLPTPPSVSSPVNYAQNATATALTATGTNLLWYTEATGGTSSATAPIPSTTMVGTTSYWVSQTNANGCESGRAKIDVTITGACLGGAGNQARLYSPISADFDGDNDKDIIALDEGGAYWLYKNNGIGNFTAQQILNGLGWSTLEWKDLDGDGDIDLVSTAGKIYLNNGSGTFTQLVTGTFWTASGTINVVKIADFNKDGKQDILWLNSNMNAGYNNQLWFNNGTTGNPNFTLGSEFDNVGLGNNSGSVIGDIDKDGDIDLIVCSGGGWNGRVYKNNGSGVFTSSQTLSTYTGNGFIMDWDNDGDNDFLAYDGYNNWGLKLWTNDGTGTFSTPSTSSLIDPTVGFVRQIVDLNDDNYLDVVCSNGSGARYYLNSGCSLVLNTQVLTNANNGTVVDDYNNNGKKDIFCAARDAQSCLNLLNLSPTATTVLTPSVSTPVTYCQNATASALTATGTSLKWYTTATGGAGSATALIPSTATAGTTSYWVSQTNANGCESDRAKIDVTINSLPAAPSVSTPVTYCQNATASALTATGISLKWYTTATGGTGSATAPIPSTATAGTTSYWVSQTNANGCEGDRAKIDVTINSLPATPSVSTPVTYCQNATASALTATGISLKWYTTAAGGTGSATAPIPSTTTAGTTSYWVTSTNANGCESGRVKIDVTINTLPAAPSIITPINYAQGSTATALTATGSNLLWYTAATGGTGNATAPTPSTTTLGTASYWVSQTVNGCESARAKIDVTVSSTTIATHLNFSNSHIDIGNLISNGSSYTKELWIKPSNISGNNIMSSNTSAFWFWNNNLQCGHGGGFIDVYAPATSMLNTWTHVAVTYNNATRTMKLYVNGNMVSQNTNVAAYSSSNIQIGAFNSGSRYTGDMDEARIWNTALSADDILRRKNCELQGNEAGLVAYYKFNQGFDASTNTSVTSLTDATSNSNNGTLNNFTLTGSTSNWLAGSPVTTGSSIPSTPSVSTPITYCQNATASALTATGTSLKWYTAATGSTGSATAPMPSTATAGTTSYWVASSNANGCESERAKIDIIINALPTAPEVSTPVSYCQNATASALTATGTNLKWYTAATGGTGSATTPTPSTATAGTTSYWVSQTNANGCESDRAKIDVTINTLPAAPSVSTPITYCQNATASALTATGSSLKWYTTATGGTGNTSAPIPSTATTNTTSYWVSQTNANACEGDRVKIDVTINALPAAPSVSTPITYCQNATASALTATGTSLKWYAAATGGAGSTTAPTPSTITVGTTSYWVSQANANGCESARTKIDVTINVTPQIPIANAQTFCTAATVANLVATGTNIKWYDTATATSALLANIALTTKTYYVSSSNANGCESVRKAVAVAITNSTQPPSVPSIAYCQGNVIPKLIATVGIGESVDWYSTAINGTLLQSANATYTPTQAGTYYAQTRNISTGCVSSQRTMGIVTMNTLPATPIISEPAVSYCQGNVMPKLTATVATGETVDWYSAATTGTMIQSSSVIFTPIEVGTYYAQSRNISTGCVNSQRAISTVTMNPLPLAPITSNPAHICEGSEMPTLTAQVQNNETVDWYNRATSGDLFLRNSLDYKPTVAGIYYAEARNITTGCVSASRTVDSIIIDPIPKSPTVQTLLSYCVGANAPILTASGSSLKWYTNATGGTANITAPQPNTSQAGSISYFVTQTTGNNCESPRSKIDVITEKFKNSLTKQVTLCKDQYYVVNLKNNKYANLTHTWTSSNGYTSSKETDTLRNSGSYYVETLTTLGCKSKDTIALLVDTTTIEANFAVATELVTVDVIKVVNISSTKNDSSQWVIPNGLKVISNTPALLELVANDTGSYKLGLITYKGACNAVSYQDVTVYTKTFNQSSNDSLYFVKTFTAFPNPSKGENVNVKIELSKESSVRLRLIEVSTNITINDRTLPKADTHSVDYGSSLKKGSYILFLESPYGRSVLKIIVL